MTDHTTIDDLALIKGEITANLTVVHNLIAPEPPEHDTIANAVRALEQVTGALQLLGLPTTARLVDEMARLVDQLDETEPAAVAAALDVLEQALRRLDEHLERLAGGFDEPPQSLWPTIDDVRAASRRMPLTHSELPVLAASGGDGDLQWLPEELEFLAEIMRQARPQFHRYLLEWYRHDPHCNQLTRMTRLCRDLARHLHSGLLADLFGLVEVLCTALEDGRLAVSSTTDTLLERVDWVMKPLAHASPVWPEFEALTLIEQVIEVLDMAGVERQELARLRRRYLADTPERQAEPPLAADPTQPPLDHVLERLGQAEPPTRASAQQLNRLLDQAGEIAIYNTHLKRCNTRQAAVLDEFNAVLARLHEQLHQLERETGTPNAAARGMPASQCAREIAKTLDELTGAHALLAEPQQEIANLLDKQARLNHDLQTGLLRTRLAPFAQIVPKLHRLVRRVASDLGKSARLEVVGQEVELDRILLERLVTPLEHLLRNAVDHGLEDPRVRADRGKPIIGTIRLQLRREGNDVAIDVRDDGRGIDASAIVRKARERGLLAPESNPATAELLPLLLEPGFTTCERSTQISGRGIGLDVVASELQADGGRIALDSAPGQGACFTIHLPLNLVLIAAFLVKTGSTTYAVPHNTVEGVGRIAREDLLAIHRGETRTFSSRGEQYEIAHLGCLLEPDSQPEIGQRRWQPLLLARLEARRVAVHVDQLIGSRRILIKPFGQQMAGIGWLSGGTVLNDGRVALVLDMQALLRPDAGRGNGLANCPQNNAWPERACVMVVDDSLTARHATQRWLQRHGIEVILARDGVEALMLLDERRPDLLLLDVEMPRMDGFELTRHIRGSARLHDLPIVMITSLTDARHRQQARALGIEQYLGKPYRESELLEIITALLVADTQSAAAQRDRSAPDDPAPCASN